MHDVREPEWQLVQASYPCRRPPWIALIGIISRIAAGGRVAARWLSRAVKGVGWCQVMRHSERSCGTYGQRAD